MDSRKDLQAFQTNGIAIETWYEAAHIDPSDLSAVQVLEVMPADSIIRPYMLTVDGNEQSFPTEEQRAKYLAWRIKLAEKRSVK